MVLPLNIGTLLLLAGSSAAAPRWWAYHGNGNIAGQGQSQSASAIAAPSTSVSTSAAVQQQQKVEAAYTPPPGGVVSNGILYITTTIYLQPGQSPPTGAAPAPAAASSPAQVAPAAQVPAPQASSASTSAAASPQAPAAQPVSSQAAANPATTTATQQQAATSPASSSVSGGSSSGTITSDMVLAIAPQTGSCYGAPYADECATAAQAAPAFNSVFSTYGINTKGAQAAVMAWELFESGQLKYKMNHFPAPGNPGQGTRCMMMPQFVSEYATAVVGAAKVSAAGSPAAVLALVNGDDVGSFGGGAWYMKTKCPNLIAQFATAPDAAWSSFMTSCVQTTDTADRDALWTAAKAALGV